MIALEFLGAKCRKKVSYFVALLCAFFGASIVSGDVFAAQIPNKSFSTSNLVVTAGSNREVVPEGGTIDCSSSIGLEFDWEINSDTTLAAGDTLRANIRGVASESHIPLSIRETAPVDILDENNEVIATWRGISDGIIEIEIAEGGAGASTLTGGHIYTGMNLLVSSCRNYDVDDVIMVDTTRGAGSQDVRHVTIKKATYNAAPRHYGIASLTTVKSTLSAFTPTQAINSIYASNGDELIGNNDIIKDLWIEADSSETFGEYTADIAARVAVPAGTVGNVANMEGGVSGNGINVPLLECSNDDVYPCKKKVDANDGETKEAFIERLKQAQGNQAIIPYGRFGDAIIAYFGDIPSTNSSLTYKKAIQDYTDNECDTFYCFSPNYQPAEVTGAIDEAVGEDNVYGGEILYYDFVSSLYFAKPLSVDGQTVTSTGTWHYRNGNNRVIEDSKSVTKSVSIGSGTAVVERGTASLQLVDKDTKSPIEGASFKLQVLNGDTWQDVAGASRTTDDEGKLAVESLDDGKYRWVQTAFVEHYRDDLSKYYADTRLNGEIDSFTLSSNGYNTIAINERQSFTVIFAGGSHASDNFEDIVSHPKYNDTTPVPSSESITGLNGWYFNGWDKEVATKVTEDITYTATWKAEQTSIRGNIVWLDANNDDGVRPERVYVNATMNGTTIDRAVAANSDGSFEITGMNKCDDQGNPYDYSVMTQIDGYTYRVEKNSEEVITLYLTHAPKVSLKINKYWEDNNNKYNLRPATITFNVLMDGRHSGKTATISKNEDSATIEGLDKYSNLEGDGVLARYSVYEDSIDYYTATVAANSDYEFTVTNTIDETARTDCALVAVRLLTNETVEEKAIEATITAKDGAPMPNDTEDGVVIRYVSTDGLISLDDIEFSDEGEYEYEVRLASDSYNIGKKDFRVKLEVKRDIASGTLCVVSVTVIDGEEEVPNGEFDAEISKHESENPDTAATNYAPMFTIAGVMIAALGCMTRVIRRR